MSERTMERRDSERYSYPSVVEYTLDRREDQNKKGVTVNVSRTGICLYIFNLLTVGQHITLRSVLPIPSKKAILRWTRRVDDNLYKVGMTFL